MFGIGKTKEQKQAEKQQKLDTKLQKQKLEEQCKATSDSGTGNKRSKK